jgi:predicted HAD superfamily Cof-like phosphohydrolase
MSNSDDLKTSYFAHMHPEARAFRAPIEDAVAMFMAIGNQSTHGFNARQACLYTGLQLEELAEKIEAIKGGCVTSESAMGLRHLIETMRTHAKVFKEGMREGDMLRSTHKDLIDADFDLAWVSLGALFSTSIDAIGAIEHGNYTNFDKFRGGQFIKDANGKIQKPADWQSPDFEPFTDKFIRN